MRNICVVDLLPYEALLIDHATGASVCDASGGRKFLDGFQRIGSLLALSHVGGSSGAAANYPAGLVNGTAGTTLTLTNNLLHAVPFVAPPRLGVLNRIGIYVTTGNASCEVRLGIYDSISEANLYPNALLFDSGALAAATTSTAVTANPGLQLVPGKLYWAVLNASVPGSGSIIRSLTVGACCPIFGIDDTLAGTTFQIGLGGTRTYAALPATFPASVAALTTTPASIMMRYSA